MGTYHYIMNNNNLKYNTGNQIIDKEVRQPVMEDNLDKTPEETQTQKHDLKCNYCRKFKYDYGKAQLTKGNNRTCSFCVKSQINNFKSSKMDERNKTALNTLINQGETEFIKACFTGDKGESLTYSEMRERYG